ncbi:hypothetical protein [Deinococcus gobiensis]|uniref:Uncharacterized protein n=1 Tax=Deinococcus gobiensis (strain DSM 21396 / JCM 16679 / CGMCC 1.7299 / I-0) TaxID=745776 RepID=H8GX78_DEIGI|nr:hypothetical protein [Deinococcus gobiensis]AFD25807.1 hypothetical protein DGo_CA1880 [Deinococcus gobiensis I-0]
MGRLPSLLLFLAAYATALLLAPFYRADALDAALRLVLLACAACMFLGFLGFVLSFRRPLAPEGDAHAE